MCHSNLKTFDSWLATDFGDTKGIKIKKRPGLFANTKTKGDYLEAHNL